MKKINQYKYFWLPAIVLSLIACNSGRKQLNPMVTLWRKDKIPYGTYYAYENMKYIFPGAKIKINENSPASFKFIDEALQTNGNKKRKAYIIISPQVFPDKQEINALMNFVGEGNQLFISSFRFGDSLLAELKIKLRNNYGFMDDSDVFRLSIYQPVTYDSLSFQYPGISLDKYADSMDTQYTTILGRDANGRADFIKMGYKGGGAIYLHFAPIAFTNFFLLHKQNKSYYDNVFSYLPLSVDEVKWDDYFRYGHRSGFSALQYIFGNSSLKWAFWLILLLFLIIYLFESKRRQKLIPVIQLATNSSLDFVKTIGRLYYQQKDNGNLVLKMITHFLDHVRTKYNLSTSVLDDDFAERLSYKSGFDKQELKELIHDINQFQHSHVRTDEALLELNRKMEAFYKQS